MSTLTLRQAPSPAGFRAPEPPPRALCPWLIDPNHGTLTIRGRARLPEGQTRPTATDPGELTIGPRGETTGPVPVGTFSWVGEAFTVTFPRFPRRLLSYADDLVSAAFFEIGDAVFRIDVVSLEAPSELEDQEHIGGYGAEVVSLEGRPTRLEVEHVTDEEDLERAAAGFRAVFAGHAELGPWASREEPGDPWTGKKAPPAWFKPTKTMCSAEVRLVGGSL